MTLTLALSAFRAIQAHAIGITVYQHGTVLGSTTAKSTAVGDRMSNSAPLLTVTPSASGGPVLVQLFDYAPGQVAYTLTRL